MKTDHDKIIDLMNEHGLGFVFNPGGGQFTCKDSSYPLYGFNCQVYPDVPDSDADTLAILEAAITKALVK